MYLIGLQHCFEDLRNIGICLNCFEPFLQKIQNKSENRKEKSKRNQKKEKGQGEPNRPSR
jgi:hypothetical protein